MDVQFRSVTNFLRVILSQVSVSQRVKMVVRVSIRSVSVVKGSMKGTTVRHVSFQDSADEPLLQLPILLAHSCSRV